jgi:nucleoside phosphorylase
MKASEIRGLVDFGIITIREDEFEAVLQRFPKSATARGRRLYNVSQIQARSGESYTTAAIRVLEQGSIEAQSAAVDLIDELNPQWILVVGIAGGVPAYEFTLGDVVASTRIYDFTVGAVQQDGSRQYSVAGGPIHPEVSSIVANLPAMREELGSWGSDASIGAARPPVNVDATQFYGSPEWIEKARATLASHFEGGVTRKPLVRAGAIASSGQVLKNTDIAGEWLQGARQILAVEMESAGVYMIANQRHVPVLAIRGISDIIGVKRDPRWTEYACHTAAAFARAFVGAGLIDARAPNAAPREQAPPPRITPGRGTPAAQGRAAEAPAPRGSARSRSVERDKVFICFANPDRQALFELREVLAPLEDQGLLSTWDATQIGAGEVKERARRDALNSARVAVLLISKSFLASGDQDLEVSALLSAGVPLLCLHVDYSLADLATYKFTDPETGAASILRLGDLVALNEPDKPLRSLSAPNKNAALIRAAKKINDIFNSSR